MGSAKYKINTLSECFTIVKNRNRVVASIWHGKDSAEIAENLCAALNNKETAKQATNRAIMPCSCRRDVILGQEVIVIDKQCAVHKSTAQ